MLLAWPGLTLGRGTHPCEHTQRRGQASPRDSSPCVDTCSVHEPDTRAETGGQRCPACIDSHVCKLKPITHRCRDLVHSVLRRRLTYRFPDILCSYAHLMCLAYSHSQMQACAKTIGSCPRDTDMRTMMSAYTHRLGCAVQGPTSVCVMHVVVHAHLYMAMCVGCTYPGPAYRCVMLCTHS